MLTISASVLRKQALADKLANSISDETLSEYVYLHPSATQYPLDPLYFYSYQREDAQEVIGAFIAAIEALGYKVNSKIVPAGKNPDTEETRFKFEGFILLPQF